MNRDKLIVQGLNGLDGEYDFSLMGMMSLGHPESLTNRESHLLKNMTGIRVGELEDALMAGDSDVLVGIGTVVMQRHGKTVNHDLVWDAPVGALEFSLAEPDEDDADPPPKPPSGSPKENETSSGDDSSSVSESQESDPSPTGHPESEKSAD